MILASTIILSLVLILAQKEWFYLLTNNNFNQIKHISRLKPYTIEDKMVLDDFTIKNLELSAQRKILIKCQFH